MLTKVLVVGLSENNCGKSIFESRGYCLITTGGATIETIKKYIENQGVK